MTPYIFDQALTVSATEQQMNATHIIEANIKAHSIDGYSVWHVVAAAHEASIRMLVDELNVLQGLGQSPASGCHHADKVFGDATVLVEYEHSNGEAPIYDADHPGVGPGREASVSVLRVFINGAWCDADDVVPDVTRARWEGELLESLAEGEDK